MRSCVVTLAVVNDVLFWPKMFSVPLERPNTKAEFTRHPTRQDSCSRLPNPFCVSAAWLPIVSPRAMHCSCPRTPKGILNKIVYFDPLCDTKCVCAEGERVCMNI